MSKNYSGRLLCLRILGLLEGLSYITLLGICMPLKYIYTTPGPTRYVGMIHGLLFLAYCLFVLIVRNSRQWNARITLLALLASLVPFGTFVADRKIFAK